MKNKGITLIALIITIIVLLILAGVSIATLTGNNGVITQVNKARGQTEEESAREKVAVEVLGSRGTDGKIDIDKLNENLRNIQGITGLPTTGLPAIVTVDGYDVLINADGRVIRLLKAGEISTSTQRDNYSDGTKTATIPEGFKVSENNLEQTIDEGLVVIGEDGSEFIWIPVETAVASSEEEGDKVKAMAVNLGTEAEPKYRGLLYDFTSTSSIIQSGCTTTTDSFREPVYLTDENWADESAHNTVITEEGLQKEYNEMIESVKRYGGFYVGKYEVSESNGKVASKANSIALTENIIGSESWYELYTKCKTYDIGSVKSTMIWGSQWDAMMNWLIKKGIDVTSLIVPNGGTKNKNATITGEVGSTDIVGNIYDLYGGRQERSLEGYGTKYRLIRGGRYGLDELGIYTSPSSRGIAHPIEGSVVDTSRITLNIM